jgi:hypothetical protein
MYPRSSSLRRSSVVSHDVALSLREANSRSHSFDESDDEMTALEYPAVLDEMCVVVIWMDGCTYGDEAWMDRTSSSTVA